MMMKHGEWGEHPLNGFILKAICTHFDIAPELITLSLHDDPHSMNLIMRCRIENCEMSLTISRSEIHALPSNQLEAFLCDGALRVVEMVLDKLGEPPSASQVEDVTVQPKAIFAPPMEPTTITLADPPVGLTFTAVDAEALEHEWKSLTPDVQAEITRKLSEAIDNDIAKTFGVQSPYLKEPPKYQHETTPIDLSTLTKADQMYMAQHYGLNPTYWNKDVLELRLQLRKEGYDPDQPVPPKPPNVWSCTRCGAIDCAPASATHCPICGADWLSSGKIRIGGEPKVWIGGESYPVADVKITYANDVNTYGSWPTYGVGTSYYNSGWDFGYLTKKITG